VVFDGVQPHQHHDSGGDVLGLPEHDRCRGVLGDSVAAIGGDLR
jgi:hypothetical protein